MTQPHGWDPLPPSLKFVFVLFVIGFAYAFLGIPSAYSVGFPVLGFQLFGLAAVLGFLANMAVILLLIIAMWKRASWTWMIGIAFATYASLNGLLNLVWSWQLISSSAPDLSVINTSADEILLIGVMSGVAFGIALNVVYLIIFYKTRSYFLEKNVS